MTPVFLVFHDAANGRIITEFIRYGDVSTFFLPNQVEGNIYMRQERGPSCSSIRIDLYDEFATLSAYHNSKKKPVILTGNKAIELPFSTSAHQKSIILREQDHILSSAGRWSLEWYRTELGSHPTQTPLLSLRYSTQSDEREEFEAEQNSSTTSVKEKAVQASETMEIHATSIIKKAHDDVLDIKKQLSTFTVRTDFSMPTLQALPHQAHSATDPLHGNHNVRSSEEEKKGVQEMTAKKLADDEAQAKRDVCQASAGNMTRSDEEEEEGEKKNKKPNEDQAHEKSIARSYEDMKKAMQEAVAKHLAEKFGRTRSLIKLDDEKKRRITTQKVVVEELADDEARAGQQLDGIRANEPTSAEFKVLASEEYFVNSYESKGLEPPAEGSILLDTDLDQASENAAVKRENKLRIQESERAPELSGCLETISPPVADQLSNEILATTAAVQNNIVSQDKQEATSLVTNTSLDVDLNYDPDVEQTHPEPATSVEIEADISFLSGDHHSSQSICDREPGLFGPIQDKSEEIKTLTDLSLTPCQISKTIKRHRESNKNENHSVPLVKKFKQAPDQNESSNAGRIKFMKTCTGLNEVEDDSKPFVKKIKQTANYGETSNIRSRAAQPTVVRLDELNVFATNFKTKADHSMDITEQSNPRSQKSSDIPRPPVVDIPHLDLSTLNTHPEKVGCPPKKGDTSSETLPNNNLQVESATPSSVVTDSVLSGSLTPIVVFSTTTSKVARDRKIITLYKRLGGLVVADIRKANMFCVGNTSLKKTAKLILAVALGKNIVTDKWFEDTYTHQKFPDTEHYLPRDTIHEKEWHFDLAQAINRGKRGLTLLNGFDVYFTSQIQDELAELKHDLKQIALTLGANRVAMKLPQDIATDHKVVIVGSTNKDRQGWMVERLKQRLYNKDLLSMAALRGRLELNSEEFVIETFIKEEEEQIASV